jgi:hypothetical protein
MAHLVSRFSIAFPIAILPLLQQSRRLAELSPSGIHAQAQK